jgi:hypothetical protein
MACKNVAGCEIKRLNYYVRMLKIFYVNLKVNLERCVFRNEYKKLWSEFAVKVKAK